MSYRGRELTSGNYLKLDDIQSQFNGSTTTFNLTSGGSAFYPGSVFSLLVSLAGVVQEAISAYTINQNTITFASAPQASDDFFCVVLGTALGIGVPGEGTVSGSKLTEPFDYDDGMLYLDSASDRVGINSTAPRSSLDVRGNVIVAGVVTATTFSGSFTGALTGTATSTTNIPNLTGAITSSNTTTSLGSFTSANLATALTDETGSGSAVFSTSPTLVTPVLGAATATSIVVSSGSTFTNGPILVGTATSTGTASQPLQVTGGAYVSGSVGIGTINPQTTLQIVRNADPIQNNGALIGLKHFTSNSAYPYAGISIDHYCQNTGLNQGGAFIQFSNNGTQEALIQYDDDIGVNNGLLIKNNTDGPIYFQTNGANERLRIDSVGNILIGTASSTGTASQPLQVTGGAYVSGSVGIGTNNPTYKLQVVGSFAATTKSFVIDHPTKPNYKLRYASLEGEENGVYVRGRTTENIIELPEYWTELVDKDSITVNLTPIGNKHIWIEEINNNKVYIDSDSSIDCFYTVFAERKDVEKLIVEIQEN
jgi:hypothetical protein